MKIICSAHFAIVWLLSDLFAHDTKLPWAMLVVVSW
uniref:Uncharacterized protein n=1 Tax=Setaria viridis TaxID=4556 RepID=A0A4U6TU64_SETVI|nr:hypothetical protein SEVIR_7G241550v2 [Setaria viridis]